MCALIPVSVRWAADDGSSTPLDEGNTLLLRLSQDDLARLRGRATVANAPATVFGLMTAAKDAQVSGFIASAPCRLNIISIFDLDIWMPSCVLPSGSAAGPFGPPSTSALGSSCHIKDCECVGGCAGGHPWI